MPERNWQAAEASHVGCGLETLEYTSDISNGP